MVPDLLSLVAKAACAVAKARCRGDVLRMVSQGLDADGLYARRPAPGAAHARGSFPKGTDSDKAVAMPAGRAAGAWRAICSDRCPRVH